MLPGSRKCLHSFKDYKQVLCSRIFHIGSAVKKKKSSRTDSIMSTDLSYMQQCLPFGMIWAVNRTQHLVQVHVYSWLRSPVSNPHKRRIFHPSMMSGIGALDRTQIQHLPKTLQIFPKGVTRCCHYPLHPINNFSVRTLKLSKLLLGLKGQ